MNIEELQKFCESLPFVTTDIKWEHDLCFSIGGKMFFAIGLDNQPTKASFKVLQEEFDILLSRNGFSPAPYLARYKWIMIEDISKISQTELKQFAEKSYSLVKSKLTKKIREQLNLNN